MSVTVVVGNPKPASRTLQAATLVARGLSTDIEPEVLDLPYWSNSGRPARRLVSFCPRGPFTKTASSPATSIADVRSCRL
jgi:hypothetical protein